MKVNNVYLHVQLLVETIDFSNWRLPIKVHHQFQFMVVAENRAFKLDPPAKLNNLPPGLSYFFPLSVDVDYRKLVFNCVSHYENHKISEHLYSI